MSSKSGPAKTSVVRRWETPSVKGGSSANSTKGRSRSVVNQLTTTELATIHDLDFELSTKGVKGSSNTPSSQTGHVADVLRGGRR